MWEKVKEIKDRKVTILLGTKHKSKVAFMLIIKKAFAGRSLLPGKEIKSFLRSWATEMQMIKWREPHYNQLEKRKKAKKRKSGAQTRGIEWQELFYKILQEDQEFHI